MTKKKQILNSFIQMCEDSKGERPSGFTYRDVAKVVSERYATQDVETVKLFFRSKGRKTNNHPYTYPEELPVGTSTIISNDLLEVRTTASVGYGSISPVDEVVIPDDLKQINWEEQE